jgi:hypothetical protein
MSNPLCFGFPSTGTRAVLRLLSTATIHANERERGIRESSIRQWLRKSEEVVALSDCPDVAKDLPQLVARVVLFPAISAKLQSMAIIYSFRPEAIHLTLLYPESRLPPAAASRGSCRASSARDCGTVLRRGVAIRFRHAKALPQQLLSLWRFVWDVALP